MTWFEFERIAETELARWRELARRAAEPNPFFEPEFVLPAARHLGARGVRLLVAKDHAGDWLGCLPLCPSAVHYRLHLPIMASWCDPWYASLGTPLLLGDELEAAAERILDLALPRSRSPLIKLNMLGADGPVAAALFAVLAQRGLTPASKRFYERAVINRETLAGGALSVIAPRHRRDLRRLGRRLEDELDAPLDVSDQAASAAAVEDFMALEASGWKAAEGGAMLCAPEHASFFREVCAGFRESGRLQLLRLGTESRAVSYKCNLLCDDGVFCTRIAFDDALSHYRPGVQLELRMLEIFATEMRQPWMDSCTLPGHTLFESLWPDRRPIGSYLVPAAGSPDRTVPRGGELVRDARPLVGAPYE